MRILFTSAFVALTLSLVGCGSDDSSSSTTTDTGTSTTDTGTSSDTGSSTTDTGSSTTDTGSSTDTGSATDVGGDTAPLSPTFTNVYTTIIAVKCTPCHTTAPGSGSLDMSSKATAYTNLVGVNAAGLGCGSSGLKRVVASDSANSLLFKKVNPSPPCGGRMPLGGTPLADSDIALIKNWIDAGAKND